MVVGQGREFDDFYQAVFGRLVGQLFLVTGSLQEAEDVAQEALCRAAAHWQRLRDYEVPEAWVRKVALNLAVSGIRKSRRRLLALTGMRPPAPPPALSDDTVALVEALRRLPVRQREALVLHYLLDMPVAEVARALAVSPGTVKSWLARGRKTLAAQLGEQEEVSIPHG